MTPPRTTLVLQSVQFSASSSTGCSACYSCPRQSPGSSHLPAPQTLRVLQLYYTVASSQLLAAQIAPPTKVVRQCRQFSASSSTDCSAYKRCTRKSPVLSLHLARLLRVLKLYCKVASSQPPPRQITLRTKVVLESRQFSAASSTDCSAY